MDLRTILNIRFGGKLHAGRHGEGDGACCALELIAAAKNKWTDIPVILRTWDLRTLNDAYSDASLRTRDLIPVLERYAGCMDWPLERHRDRTRGGFAVSGSAREASGSMPRRVHYDPGDGGGAGGVGGGSTVVGRGGCAGNDDRVCGGAGGVSGGACGAGDGAQGGRVRGQYRRQAPRAQHRLPGMARGGGELGDMERK